MINLILYFFLLIPKTFFNLALNTIYKHNRFFKALLETNFKFVLSKKISFIFFFLYLVLLLSKLNSIIEKESCKKYIFEVYSDSYLEIIFALLVEVIIFYI